MTALEELILSALKVTDDGLHRAALRALQGADPEPLLTAEALAGKLNVSRQTIYKLKVPASVRVGGSPRFKWSDVVAFLNRQQGGVRA